MQNNFYKVIGFLLIFQLLFFRFKDKLHVFRTFVVKYYWSRFIVSSPFLFLTSFDEEIRATLYLILLLLTFYFIIRKLSSYKLKINLFFYPLFLILISLFILVLTDNNGKIGWFSNVLVFASIFIIITFFIYYIFYSWRTLSMSFLSFVRFSINMIQLSLYILTFYLLMQNTRAIYLHNLSTLSQYRYLVFSVVSLIFVIIIIVGLLFRINTDHVISKITYPYLKEEIRSLLYTWNNTIFGDYCSKLIDLLGENRYMRFFYFALNFVIFYSIRIIALFAFINFTFFHGDLRYLFYISPFLLIVWILSFLDYYFITFLEQHSNYLRLLVNVTTKNTPMEHSVGVVETNSDNLSFTLTSYATQRGFALEDLSMLASEWIKAARITANFIWYRRLIKFFTITLFSMHLICWYFITYIFFISKTGSGIVFSGFWSSLFKSGTKSNSKFFSRSYAIEAYKIRPSNKRQLEEATSGDYKAPHPVMADKEEQHPTDPQQGIMDNLLME